MTSKVTVSALPVRVYTGELGRTSCQTPAFTLSPDSTTSLVVPPSSSRRVTLLLGPGSRTAPSRR
jgi:hypothetical protein